MSKLDAILSGAIDLLPDTPFAPLEIRQKEAIKRLFKEIVGYEELREPNMQLSRTVRYRMQKDLHRKIDEL